jgi:chorismate mutase
MNFFVLFYCYLFLSPVVTFQLQPPKLDWKQLKLKFIRKKIDLIDDQIYHLTNKRIQHAKRLQQLKPCIRDPVREVAIVSRLQKKEKLEKRFVREMWSLLFKQSYIIQEKELEKNQD